MDKKKIKIKEVQKYLQKENIDGWLIYDFHEINDLAKNFLELLDANVSRRFFYWIPKQGLPIKIVHSIEFTILDNWPGEKKIYFSWGSLRDALREILKNVKIVAMEYSKDCNNPYISKVDGGTIDLIRSYGVRVSSSSSFLPNFTAVLDKNQIEMHKEAANFLDDTANKIWEWIGKKLEKNNIITEYDVQQKILSFFSKNNYISSSYPICSVNSNSAIPHYSPKSENSRIIKKGDLILIDLWCKKNKPRSIYADITRVAIAAKKPSLKQKEIFSIVLKAQKTATDFIEKKLKEGNSLQGWEVDEICREVIRKAGYEKYFIHRTGHNIEMSVHGSGANLDNLEMHDERILLPNTCFSIEPGIYLPNEFGIRLEHDAYISSDNNLIITGGIEEEIFCLM
jgi:Xaa-Pro aminopeptidase